MAKKDIGDFYTFDGNRFVYYVKFFHKWLDRIVYGRLNQYHESAEKCAKEGKVIIEDLETAQPYAINKSEVTPIKGECVVRDHRTGELIGGNEAQIWLYNQFKAAQKRSDAIPKDTVAEGLLLALSVADGYAYYVVTKVNKRTCKIEWRGYCPDRWFDRRYGYEATIPHSEALMFRCRPHSFA